MIYQRHPIISVGLIFLVTIFRIINRYIFGSMWGLLCLSIILYINSENILGTKPITLYELCMLFFSLSESMKAAIVSSLITIIGFIAAYATASSNWKAQLKGTIKAEASFECVQFFKEAHSMITQCDIYANSLKSTVEKIQSDNPKSELLFHTNYDRKKAKEFILNREGIVAKSINSHTFLAKYNSILINTNGVQSNLDLAISSLTVISRDIWFTIPYDVTEDDDQISTFVSQIDIDSLDRFLKTVKEHHNALSFHPSAAAAVLMDPIVGSSWNMLMILFKVKKVLWEKMSEIYYKKMDNK
jgi:hypothetical protein